MGHVGVHSRLNGDEIIAIGFVLTFYSRMMVYFLF